MDEVRCPACGRTNRLPQFFIMREAHCGACKAPLPEPAHIKGLRPIIKALRPIIKAVQWTYVWRRLVAVLAFILFIVGIVISAQWDSWMLGLACSAQQRPPHGLFARYYVGLAMVPLTITSAPGADYFVKFVEPGGFPVASFYIHGGEDLRALLPTGTFIERNAAGDRWCGEQNLFGTSTVIEQGLNAVTLTNDGVYTLKLEKQTNGNFPTKAITSKQF